MTKAMKRKIVRKPREIKNGFLDCAFCGQKQGLNWHVESLDLRKTIILNKWLTKAIAYVRSKK